MNKFYLQIITPKKVIFDGECTMLEYNTTEGYVGILYGHMPMTQIIAPGKFVVYEEGVENPLVAALHSGTVKIMPDTVVMLAETLEYKDEIDVKRAENALMRAKKRFEEKLVGFDEKRARLSLMRAEVRLEVAKVRE